MSTLSHDDVRHIAKLARVNLQDKEVDKFTTNLTSILECIEQLQELNTDDIEPTSQVTGSKNSFRSDEVAKDGSTREELLECSPLPIVDQQIQTPSAHG